VCEHIPFLILPMKQLSREPPGKKRGPFRPKHPPKRRERAVRQDAGAVSNHRLKRHVRAVGQDMGRVSNRMLRRSAASEPSGKTPGPSRIKSSAEALRVSRWARRRARLEPSAEAIHERAIWQAAGPVSNRMHRRASRRVHQAVHGATRQASRCRGAACDPALKPQLVGAADTKPNPLDYSL